MDDVMAPLNVAGPMQRFLGLAPTAMLLGLLAAVTIHQLVEIPTHLWFAFDIEIPLQAAQRWLHGQPPYLASSFVDPQASTQPFL